MAEDTCGGLNRRKRLSRHTEFWNDGLDWVIDQTIIQTASNELDPQVSAIFPQFSPNGVSKKELILETAAILFASHEYSGTSMRAIAKLADVSQSLIHYHYSTKEKLFGAVFDHYMMKMNVERIKMLREFLSKEPIDDGTTLEELIEILVSPWLTMARSSDLAEREFTRFVIRSAYHEKEWSRELVADHFRAVTNLGVEAFMRLVPEFDYDSAFRAYIFSVSIFYMPISAPSRLETLAGRKIDLSDSTALLPYGIRFAAAGIRAMQRDLTPPGT